MKRLSATFAATLFLGAVVPGAHSADPPVTIVEDGSNFTLANGIVTAKVSKRSRRSRLPEIQGPGAARHFRATPAVTGRTPPPATRQQHASRSTRRPTAATAAKFPSRRSPAAPRSAMGPAAVPSPTSRSVTPWAAAIRASTPIRSSRTRPSIPPRRSAKPASAAKLNGKVFDYMTIDANRRKVMPKPEDWDKGHATQHEGSPAPDHRHLLRAGRTQVRLLRHSIRDSRLRLVQHGDIASASGSSIRRSNT